MSRRRYLRVLIITTILSLFAVATFNVLIDPYGYFQVIDLPRLNQIKPYPEGRSFKVKLAQMERFKPSALILGNSRAEIGFDPAYPGFFKAGLRVHNAALPGTNVAKAREMFIHAQQVESIKLTVIALEFLDYLTDPSATFGALDEVESGQGFQWLQERLTAIFSASAFVDAIRTLTIQNNPDASTLTNQGFNPLFEYNHIVATEGYYNLFLQRIQENFKTYRRLPKSLDARGAQQSAAWTTLQDLIERSIAQDSESHLIIYPYHAQILLLFENTGLWEIFEDWKKRLVLLVEEIRKKHPEAHVSLWDFSGYHIFATEPIPKSGDLSSKVLWYWEAGHFKKELGDKVLGQVLGLEKPLESNFGVLLDSRNIDTHLASV